MNYSKVLVYGPFKRVWWGGMKGKGEGVAEAQGGFEGHGGLMGQVDCLLNGSPCQAACDAVHKWHTNQQTVGLPSTVGMGLKMCLDGVDKVVLRQPPVAHQGDGKSKCSSDLHQIILVLECEHTGKHNSWPSSIACCLLSCLCCLSLFLHSCLPPG